MKNFPDICFFKTGLSVSVVESVFKFISEEITLGDAAIGGDVSILDKEIRNCLCGNIPREYWISGLLDYYIREVNRDFFHYDLVGWHDDIQFLYYNGKDTGYKWHSDISAPETDVGLRKLSLVLCLSSKEDYEGGELQILLDGRRDMITLKLDLGDCVIFPSTAMHRVRPLKSGERSVIVGWYGGPDFR